MGMTADAAQPCQDHPTKAPFLTARGKFPCRSCTPFVQKLGRGNRVCTSKRLITSSDAPLEAIFDSIVPTPVLSAKQTFSQTDQKDF